MTAWSRLSRAVCENPIIVTYVHMRPTTSLLFAGALVASLGIASASVQDSSLQGTLFGCMVAIVVFLTFVPYQIGRKIAQELNGGTFDFHGTTPTSPFAYAVGFLIGIPCAELIFLAPVLLVAFLYSLFPVPALHLVPLMVPSLLLSAATLHSVLLLLCVRRAWPLMIATVLAFLVCWAQLNTEGLASGPYAAVSWYLPAAFLANIPQYQTPLLSRTALVALAVLLQCLTLVFSLRAVARRIRHPHGGILSRLEAAILLAFLSAFSFLNMAAFSEGGDQGLFAAANLCLAAVYVSALVPDRPTHAMAPRHGAISRKFAWGLTLAALVPFGAAVWTHPGAGGPLAGLAGFCGVILFFHAALESYRVLRNRHLALAVLGALLAPLVLAAIPGGFGFDGIAGAILALSPLMLFSAIFSKPEAVWHPAVTLVATLSGALVLALLSRRSTRRTS